MKRIILFNIYAFMILIGGYLLYYGITDAITMSAPHRDFETLPETSYYDGLVVEGEIYQTVGEFGTTVVQPSFLGIPLSKPITQYVFVIPAGYKEDILEQKYLLLVASNSNDVELLQSISRLRPAPRGEDAPALEFTGVIHEMSDNTKSQLKDFILDRRELLTGIDASIPIYETKIYARIFPYIINLRTRQSTDHLPIIAGGVLTAAGVLFAVILIIRILREKNGY